jgi:hypothetical protein
VPIWQDGTPKVRRKYAESTPLRAPKEALCLEFFYSYKKALAEGSIFDLGNGMREGNGWDTGESGSLHPARKGGNKREKADETRDVVPVNGRLKHAVLSAI